MGFSKHIIYVDESGDHRLDAIDPEYPVFVLSFCIFEKEEYRKNVMPAMTKLKFDVFGHDMVVLHEIEIRKKLGYFATLNREAREAFMASLTEIVKAADFTLVAVLIDKKRLVDQYSSPSNPYNLAMKFALERVYKTLQNRGDVEDTTHVVFEARGKKEDAELELEFRRVCAGANSGNARLPLEIVFAHTQINSTGLQFADMTARPIGINYLRPQQSNKAFETLSMKFDHSVSGKPDESAFICFP